jgi:hypothetical protein
VFDYRGKWDSLYTIRDHSILVIREFIIFFKIVQVLVEVEFKAALVDGPGIVDVVPIKVFLADRVVLDRLLSWKKNKVSKQITVSR